MARVLITDAIGIDIDHLDIPGSVTIGSDGATDTLEVLAGITTDLVPTPTGTLNLGSQTSSWAMTVTDQIEHEYSFTTTVQFQHQTTVTNVNTIEIYRYDASLYVGGRMTVWMAENAVSPDGTGMREYVFVNDTAQGVIDLIGGAQAVIGTNPISTICAATWTDMDPDPDQIVLSIDNTDATTPFPTGSNFLGRAIITLFKSS